MERACPATAPGGLVGTAERRNVHPPARPEPHGDPDAERQRHRQGAQVVDDCPNADPARALPAGPREGERERDEDQGRDDHAEQPHEQIGDRLQHDGRLPEEHPDEHATPPLPRRPEGEAALAESPEERPMVPLTAASGFVLRIIRTSVPS